MSIIPIIPAARMLIVLGRAGFRIIRKFGSHIILKNPITLRKTVVAFHRGDLSRKMITMILKQAGLSISDFLRLLK